MSAYDLMDKADFRLTLDVVSKVIAAQRRGTLSDRLHTRRLPTQVILENVTEQDFLWVQKHYPGGTEQIQIPVAKKRKRNSPAKDSARYVVWLRGKYSDERNDWSRPKLEVWGLIRPHLCAQFVARVNLGGTPRWTCASYGCGKPVTITKAREMGLLPPKG